MALKTAGYYIAWQLELQISKISRHSSPIDLGQQLDRVTSEMC